MAELAIHCADGLSLEGLIKLAIRNADCEDYLTCDNKNESLESLLKRAFSVDELGNYALNVCGCSGGVEPVGGLTEVTYAELVALIGSSGLTPGWFYLLTDFATVHYFSDNGSTLVDTNTGATEPLLLLATSVNTLGLSAYSSTYPQDIINYDWNPANYLSDCHFSSDGVNIISGWKGVIILRHDTLLDNYLPYDYRNVKFRRWAVNPNTWSSGTTYAAKAIVKDAGVTGVYISLKAGNLNHDVTDITWWVKIMDLTNAVITKYWNFQSTTMNDILTDANDYVDFYTFNDVAQWNRFERPTDDEDSLLPNIVFGGNCNTNYIGAGVFNITALSFANNSIQSYFSECFLGMFFDFNNISHEFVNNIIYNYFSGNTIGIDFIDNKIGINCFTNQFGNEVEGNVFGNNFRRNTIGSYVQNLIASNTFQLNNVSDGIQTVDFTAATHVYTTYNKTIFKREDGAARLSYINNSDVLTIVNATA